MAKTTGKDVQITIETVAGLETIELHGAHFEVDKYESWDGGTIANVRAIAPEITFTMVYDQRADWIFEDILGYGPYFSPPIVPRPATGAALIISIIVILMLVIMVLTR